MADYYIQMSETYEVNPAQVEWLRKLFQRCRDNDGNPDSDEGKALTALLDPEDIQGDLECLCSEVLNTFDLENLNGRQAGEPYVWVHHDESINIDLVLSVLARMLNDTNDDRILTGTYACTCSKPRAGEFGGGWFVVSGKKGTMTGSTWNAAEMAANSLKD